jgi:hypothetical protein
VARDQRAPSPDTDATRPPEARAWCENCSVLRTADEVTTSLDGEPICRTCGEAVLFTADEEEGAPSAPWHFKVLLLGTIGYLIYRVIWFIGWIRHH